MAQRPIGAALIRAVDVQFFSRLFVPYKQALKCSDACLVATSDINQCDSFIDTEQLLVACPAFLHRVVKFLACTLRSPKSPFCCAVNK